MAKDINVKITGDSSSLDKALRSAGQSGTKFGKTFGKVVKGGAIAAGAAFAGLAVTAKIGVSELFEAQKVGAQTGAVLKSTGKAANVSAKQVEDLAESLMLKSGVDDEAIQSGENLLLTFTRIRNEVGKGNDIFNQATKATLDMSVAMGTDMQSATILVGKALNDPIRGMTALRRVGVSFTKSQEETIKKLVESGDVMKAQKIILKELNKEFGGSAEALGKTLPGQLDILKQRFSNFAGDLMGRILPRVLKFFGGIGDAINKVVSAQGFKAKVKVIWTGVQSVALDLFEKVRDELFGSFRSKKIKLGLGRVEIEKTWNKGLVASLAEGLQGMDWSAVGQRVGEGISKAIKLTADFFHSFVEFVEAHLEEIAEVGALIALKIIETITDPKFWVEHPELLLVVAALFPFGRMGMIGGKIVKAITGPIARLLPEGVKLIGLRAAIFFMDAWAKLPGFARAIGRGIVRGLAGIVGYLAGQFREMWNKVPGWIQDGLRLGVIIAFVNAARNIFNRLRQFVRDVFNAIKGHFRSATGPLNTMLTAVELVIDAIQRLIDLIRNIPTPHINWPKPPGWLPGFASGGVVPGPVGRPMMAVVHGGETVIPVGRRSTGRGGAEVVNLILDGAVVARAVRFHDGRWAMQNG